MIKKYALLNENNIVINISVADEFWDSTGWIEYTSENPAAIDSEYFDGKFYEPKPFNSWIRDTEAGTWKAPVEKPQTNEYVYDYFWNEADLKWEEIEQLYPKSPNQP